MNRTLALCILIAIVGCNDEPRNTAPRRTGPPVVYTTFFPTTAFARRLAGDLAEVVCPLPDDADPITWQPTPDQIRAYQDADLIVLNGARFEHWPLTTSLPENRVVRTAQRFEAEWLEYKKSVKHTHGPTGEHAHEGIDGHTWMDPVLARRQAAEIRDALLRLLPDHEARINGNFAALSKDFDDLESRFRAIPTDEVILCSHPAWNYPARRFGWKIQVFEPGAPGLEMLNGGVALWEGDPDPDELRRLTMPSIKFDPCESGGGDYFERMRANLDRLATALER